MKISLIIPVKNEEKSLERLYTSICRQTRLPDEIVFVDGGSTDNTVKIAERLAAENHKIKLIKTPEASPGKGRNIGIENARNEWIALTDAGIELEKHWLQYLVEEAQNSPEAEVVFGNFSPFANTIFEKCAMISYVPAIRGNIIRQKTVVSLLLKKHVWEKIGGFPDLRAAEDLIFIEMIDREKFNSVFAPKAQIYWRLQPNLLSTFKKFVLYSKHNVWAGRAFDWHYGVARQYLLVLLFLILAVIHSGLWLLAVGAWLVARTAKRILPHRRELGLMPLLNPVYFLTVAFIALIIDLATFVGWGQAVLFKESEKA